MACISTFLTGLAILVIGGLVYGRVCERVMASTDDPTPATAQQDGIDFVPMQKWRNSLIELLNIAGTGPILGPIQGALFGPIAFITIPVSCVIAGACCCAYVALIVRAQFTWKAAEA